MSISHYILWLIALSIAAPMLVWAWNACQRLRRRMRQAVPLSTEEQRLLSRRLKDHADYHRFVVDPEDGISQFPLPDNAKGEVQVVSAIVVPVEDVLLSREACNS